MKPNKPDWEDKVLEWVDRILNSRMFDMLNAALLIFAMLYFGAHIVWWWIRHH